MNRTQIVERNKASLGLRFANYIIDVICYYLFIFIIIFIVSFFARIFESDLLIGFLVDFMNGKSTFYISIYLILFLYYYTSELFMNGRTIGKYVTGIKAVTILGGKLNTSDLLKRTFSRLVPFDGLSFLGTNGWHDSWSDTRVVKITDFENAMRLENELNNIGKE